MRILLFLLISTAVFGQVEPGKWFFGLGVNFVGYNSEKVTSPSGVPGIELMNDFSLSEYFKISKSELGFPRVSVTYMWKENIALDASFSLKKLAIINGVNLEERGLETIFVSSDLNAEYRFLNNSSLIQMYPILGAGITYGLGVKNNITDSNIGAALNLGFGLDIWTRGNFGMYAKTMYRYTAGYNLFSHNYYAVGLNYRLGSYGRRSKGGCMVNKYHF